MKKHLKKSQNKKIAGVLAGFAEYFNWNILWTRIIFAILIVFTGLFPFVLVYILMAIIMDSSRVEKVTDI